MNSLDKSSASVSETESDPETSLEILDHKAAKTKLLLGVGFALFIVLIGMIVISQAWEYGLGDDENLIGPGTAPVALGLLIVVGGLLIALKDMRSLKHLRNDHQPEEGTVKAENSGRIYLVNTVLLPSFIIAIFVGGVYLSQFTGLLLTLSATVFVCGLVIERMALRKSLIMAAATLVLGYLLFDLLLSARFPESVVGF